MSQPIAAWFAEATKAVVEATASTHAHLMRSCLVEAFNRGVEAARASIGTLPDTLDRATAEAAIKVIDALKVPEGM